MDVRSGCELSLNEVTTAKNKTKSLLHLATRGIARAARVCLLDRGVLGEIAEP